MELRSVTTTRIDAGVASGTLTPSTCLDVVSGHAAEATASTLPAEPSVACSESPERQSTVAQADQLQFKQLAEKWLEERGASSSTSEIAMCPSYQGIIAMGDVAVPM